MKFLTYGALAIGLGLFGCQTGGQSGSEQQRGSETGTQTGTEPGTTGTPTGDTGAYGTGGGTQGTQGQPPGEGGTMGGETGAMGTGGGSAGAQNPCQQLSSCYEKLSASLCQGAQADQCKQQFSTDTLPQDPAQCQSRMSQVQQQAQPYVQAQPDFQMPQECSAGGM